MDAGIRVLDNPSIAVADGEGQVAHWHPHRGTSGSIDLSVFGRDDAESLGVAVEDLANVGAGIIHEAQDLASGGGDGIEGPGEVLSDG